MYIVVSVALFAILGVDVANSASIIDINPNPLETSTADVHAIINADPASNSLKEHLASIVKLDNPIEAPPSILTPDTPLDSAVPDLSIAVPDITEPKEPSDNDDLKSDASIWYRYGGGYRSPYVPPQYYRPPQYSNYWQYENRYNQPYHNYYPQQPVGYYNRPQYGYYNYRPSSYYSENYIYSPYRRHYQSYYY